MNHMACGGAKTFIQGADTCDTPASARRDRLHKRSNRPNGPNGQIQHWLPLLFLTAALAFNQGTAHAELVIKAPPAPEKLYRVDVRAPGEIFVTGLQTWASQDADEVDDDLLTHVLGWDPTRDSAANTNWISTSSDPDYNQFLLGIYATSTSPPPTMWLYEIQATPQAYSVNWVMAEYLTRNPPGRTRRVEAVRTAYDSWDFQREWAFHGAIASRDIRSASQFNYVPAQHEYVLQGAPTINQIFLLRPTPDASVENPLNRNIPQAIQPATVPVYGYDAGRNSIALTQGTMTELLTWAMSCEGVPSPADTSINTTRPERRANAANACTHGADHVKKVRRNKTPRPSTLAFQVESETLCLGIENRSGFVGSNFIDCTKAPQFEYDDRHRLSARWKKNYWCLSAPTSVVDSTEDEWAYVRFEPCTINSLNQQWYFRNGHIYSHKGNLQLQRWSGEGMISRRQDGKELKIRESKFATGFFDARSPERSRQVELQMSWSWDQTTYYTNANYRNPWNQNYTTRSYYDYQRQTISLIDLNTSSAYSNEPPYKFCLRSNQYKSHYYDWDWTEWVRCNDTERVASEDLKWAFVSKIDAANNPNRVQWRDMSQSLLWVGGNTYRSPGSYFTFKDSILTDKHSTSFFSIRPDSVRPGLVFKTDD